jgi:endoglucanase
MYMKSHFFRTIQHNLFHLLIFTGLITLATAAQVADARQRTGAEASSQVTMENTGDWGSAFQGQATIRNTGSSEINGWTLGFEADFEIHHMWNARVFSHTGNRYVVEGTGWNENIAPGGEVSFGFIATPGGSTLPVEFVVNGSGTNTIPTPEPAPEPTPTAEPTPTDDSVIGAVAFSKKMGVGWNAGNSLEAIGGETAWGNPLLNQELFNAVKAAGFDTVRIPVAWSVFTDSDNFVIDSQWMARVTEVVEYALNADLYVIINIHWDGGWMQPTYGQQDYVNNRLAIMWEQIATNFRDYDKRLLFAGTNEVMVEGDYGTPTEEYYTVQNSFNQTFVTTVRDTGGGNADRYLIVQGFNTNIDHTVDFAVMPTDTIADRLMMEVHYYDPYNFTLNTDSNITQWGSIATDPNAVEDWANESWVDAQFQKMKSNFVDKGIAVILGEYGVASRLTISDHERYRVYWNEYVTNSAVDHSLVPIYWDNGGNGQDGSLGVFNRNDGSQLYPDIINAIVGAVK